MKEHKPPTEIQGTKVEYIKGSEYEFRGEKWVTIIPINEDDNRLWEFSLTTGKLLKTRGSE